MKLDNVLNQQIELIKPPKEDIDKINSVKNSFLIELKSNIKKNKIKAEPFLGGSLAKNTLVKKDIYDLDFFIRFASSNQDLSLLLSKLLPKNAKKIHGSRDYFQIKNKNLILEIIPVLKIKKPEQAKNVTDLSYFHVNYILKKIKKNPKLINEIRLAKTFAHAQDCYGAESYIKGFSGYSLELLITHYKSFSNFIKQIVKIDKKLIIDPERLYKNKDHLLSELNKSKLNSPIILIDPTFKERNALSGLSKETLNKFQNSCKKFLKNPSKDFFIRKPVSDKFKKYKNTKTVSIKTSKQPGDIAGTKSKKFFDFLKSRLKKEFIIKKEGFDYDEQSNIATLYLVLDKKPPTLIKGPSITNTLNLTNFKKTHPNAFIKNRYAHAKLIHNLSFNEWFNQFLKKDKKIIKDMSVVDINKP